MRGLTTRCSLWTCSLICLLGLACGCHPGHMRQQMQQAWRGGSEADGIAAGTTDPWARQASQSMSVHHRPGPGYTDPLDRWLWSDEARSISEGLEGR